MIIKECVVYETLSTRESDGDDDGSVGIGYVLHSISKYERWLIAEYVNKLHYMIHCRRIFNEIVVLMMMLYLLLHQNVLDSILEFPTLSLTLPYPWLGNRVFQLLLSVYGCEKQFPSQCGISIVPNIRDLDEKKLYSFPSVTVN